MNHVTWVTRTAFGLSDGTIHDHPFELSEKWTVKQMEAVWNWCNHDPALCFRKRRKPVFRPDIGYAEVMQALSLSDYKQAEAAALLGVDTTLVQHRIKKYKITHPRWVKNRAA